MSNHTYFSFILMKLSFILAAVTDSSMVSLVGWAWFCISVFHVFADIAEEKQRNKKVLESAKQQLEATRRNIERQEKVWRSRGV